MTINKLVTVDELEIKQEKIQRKTRNRGGRPQRCPVYTGGASKIESCQLCTKQYQNWKVTRAARHIFLQSRHFFIHLTFCH